MQSESRAVSTTSPDDVAGVGRQTFLRSLSQHERLLSIETSLEPGALIVTRFTGHEAMSSLFRFDIDCIATSAHYELKKLTGEQATLRLRVADGSSRAFHGIVTACRLLGSDGALTSYRLTLAPWLRELALRRDSYVFQDKSVPEILEEIFRDYPDANWRFDLRTALPRRSVTMQYRESDYDFMRRLLAEEGLNFFFEHHEEGPPAGNGSPRARHRLVIFDDNATLAPCSQPSIRFQRAAATERDDTVTLLTRGRQVRTNTVALASWDYKTIGAPAAGDAVSDTPANAPVLERYDGSGAYRYTDAAESARIARARTESLALEHESSQAESSVRRLAVGTWFTLTDHADANGDYAVLSIRHRGANNLQAAESPLAAHAGIERGTYRNQFLCVPRATPIRPAIWTAEKTAPGAQVVMVTGVDGEEITTERDHRVKIQFPWQRGTRAVSGQLPHPATSNAPGNETAGTWVRVAEPAAGANWGAAFVPRIGREMCVNFVAADIEFNTFENGKINAVTIPPGETLYRILDPGSGDNSICWMRKAEFDKLKSKDDWRRRFAVWANWNSNGEFVTYTVPPGKGLNVWEGVTGTQEMKNIRYKLEGGAVQIVLDPSDLKKEFLGKRQSTQWGYSNFGETVDMTGVPVLINSWIEKK